MSLGRIRIAAICVGALLTAVAFAGCGGGDDSGAPSKDDFIAQADQICADYKVAADAKEAEFLSLVDGGDLEGAADLFIETTDGITTALDDIVALGAPEGDEETINDWVALGREQVVVAGDIAESVRADDGPAIEAALAEGEALQDEADIVADEYGMIDCGSAGNDS